MLPSQRDAWLEQIQILRNALVPFKGRGKLYFEYSVPRLGKRIDVIAVIDHVLFIIEFKVGATEYSASGTDQVWDYALDLKNFHDTSHDKLLAPILIATRAVRRQTPLTIAPHQDGLLSPLHVAPVELQEAIENVLATRSDALIDVNAWESGRYSPTPTIVEAATALYAGHAVADISRNDAGAVNLTRTSKNKRTFATTTSCT
ncbi:MAG TPA: hypothetical protein VH518_05530 [Tepidisphaeraceae bacterium]